MLSGNGLANGFGYDLGIFNIAGRSSATAHTSDQAGEANAWAVRGRYDGRIWNAQTAYALSEEAGGFGSEDYRVFALAGAIEIGPWTAIGEWINGFDVRGVKNRDERVAYAHLGYQLSPRIELVARHYDGESKLGNTTRLTNTVVGTTISLFEHARSSGRLQINYLVVDGDKGTYTGVRGFRENALLIQYQWLSKST